ncbi:FAD-dependent oxidoreductase [Salinicola endophyticus]|uniref:FAD-dependent oxidoreductase n=1 Tax=Salinicola endophyticus TaxID=1949083 RepID=UPI00249B43ED|nr:FAD-dependent oxidoreductase [Salinicola endophyticus]
MTHYDSVIVGAGPAGLAAASRLAHRGLRVLLLDQGHAIDRRDRHAEAELTQGHGGAGLYSDGKFSFYPSATELWRLPYRAPLRQAYAWTRELLAAHGMTTPPFPDRADVYTPCHNAWSLKHYPSYYLPLEQREAMIANLVDSLDVEIVSDTQVISQRYDEGEARHHLQLRAADGTSSALTATTLVWAAGRFGPLALGEGIRTRFRRLEVGFRIEQPSEHAFFQDFADLDPKLTLHAADKTTEWRTFCACRHGRTVLTQTQGLWTVSGHSDGPPTARSNVGFNTRILDESLARETIAALTRTLGRADTHFDLPLSAWLADDHDATAAMERVYGAPLAQAMQRGLRQLVDNFPLLEAESTRLIGPTLEGVGWYPEVDESLRLGDRPTWVVGDACGLFRGIVAAFVSGHYAASAVAEALTQPARLQERA